MRILKSIFTFLVMFAIGGFLFYYVGREVVLSLGATALRSSVQEMQAAAKNSGVYAAECRKKGIVELNESSIKTIQLRFTSNTKYQIEVICRQFSLDPIVVKTGELPKFVEKVPGQGGIIWGEQLSGVSIQAFNKVKSVFVQNQAITIGTQADLVGAFSPVTSCAGDGFTCCPLDTTIGKGKSTQNVLDCSANCFESCVRRPVILSVSTQPFFDLKTRETEVNRGDQVTVAYVTDFAGSKTLNIKINFGDGQIQEMSKYADQTVHQYNCSQAQCRYNLEITAVNEDGIEAARTAITRVTVIVQ
jgi:hypothetical protein